MKRERGDGATDGAGPNRPFALGLNDTGLITGLGFYDDGPGGLEDGEVAYLLDAFSLIP